MEPLVPVPLNGAMLPALCSRHMVHCVFVFLAEAVARCLSSTCGRGAILISSCIISVGRACCC